MKATFLSFLLLFSAQILNHIQGDASAHGKSVLHSVRAADLKGDAGQIFQAHSSEVMVEADERQDLLVPTFYRLTSFSSPADPWSTLAKRSVPTDIALIRLHPRAPPVAA